MTYKPFCDTRGDWGYIYPRDAVHSGDTIPCPSCSGTGQPCQSPPIGNGIIKHNKQLEIVPMLPEVGRAHAARNRDFVLFGGVVDDPEPMWRYLYGWLRRQEYHANSDGEYITVWLPVPSFVNDPRMFYKMQCASAGGSIACAIDRERIPGIWKWSMTPSVRDTIPYHRRLVVA